MRKTNQFAAPLVRFDDTANSQNHLREQMDQPVKLRGSWLMLVVPASWGVLSG